MKELICSMKELISILTASDEHVSLSERVVYGIIYPLAMLLFGIIVPAILQHLIF